MSRAFSIDIDVSQLAGLSDRLGELSGEQLARATADAVNAVTRRFDEKQRAGQMADIALDADYIAKKTHITQATPGDTRATITTSGDLTIMDRYPHEVQHDPSRIDRRGRKMGERRGGVKAIIKYSAPIYEPQWFLMRLKNGNGDGVFVRTSAGTLKHMYGPSPYSLFKHQIDIGTAGLLDDLENTGAAAIADAVTKALA